MRRGGNRNRGMFPSSVRILPSGMPARMSAGFRPECQLVCPLTCRLVRRLVCQWVATPVLIRRLRSAVICKWVILFFSSRFCSHWSGQKSWLCAHLFAAVWNNGWAMLVFLGIFPVFQRSFEQFCRAPVGAQVVLRQRKIVWRSFVPNNTWVKCLDLVTDQSHCHCFCTV